jgi:hypothetical protein
MSEPLTKVDSAVQGLSSSPPKEEKQAPRRKSSSVPGVFNINDLGMSLLQDSSPWLARLYSHTVVEIG